MSDSTVARAVAELLFLIKGQRLPLNLQNEIQNHIADWHRTLTTWMKTANERLDLARDCRRAMIQANNRTLQQIVELSMQERVLDDQSENVRAVDPTNVDNFMRQMACIHMLGADLLRVVGQRVVQERVRDARNIAIVEAEVRVKTIESQLEAYADVKRNTEAIMVYGEADSKFQQSEDEEEIHMIIQTIDRMFGELKQRV